VVTGTLLQLRMPGKEKFQLFGLVKKAFGCLVEKGNVQKNKE